MTEPNTTPTPKIKRVEESLMNMNVSVKALVFIFPFILMGLSWWGEAKEVPVEMKEMSRSIAANTAATSANKNKDDLQDQEIGHINTNLVDIKDVLKEIRKDQRVMMYQRHRPSRGTNGGH